MSARTKQKKVDSSGVPEEILAQRPYFHDLSSGAQRMLLARFRQLSRPPQPATRGAAASQAAPPAAQLLGLSLGPHPGANIRVNDPAEDLPFGNRTTQSAPSIAVNRDIVVVGFNDSTLAPNYSGFAVSKNHGRVFKDKGNLVGQEFGDAVIATDGAGNFYYASLSTDAAGNSSVGVSKSTDKGNSFNTPVNASTTANAPGSFQDKEWLTVDNSDSGTDGNLYLVWTKFGPGTQILFARSTNSGSTFSAPLALSGVGNVQGAMPGVGPDGAVYVTWLDRGASQIHIRKSIDAGVTFTNPVNGGGPVQPILQIPGTLKGNIRANSFPSIAVDPEEGAVYIVYAARVGADRANVFLVTSKDGGKTWSAPVRVNDDSTNTDQWMPSVAVTDDDGVVGVMFYDRRNDPVNNLSIDVYIAISTDGGISFRPNQRITTTSFPPVVNFDPVIAFNYMGDYNQMVANDQRFYMVWGDNRDMVGARNDPNVYFAVFDAED